MVPVPRRQQSDGVFSAWSSASQVPYFFWLFLMGRPNFPLPMKARPSFLAHIIARWLRMPSVHTTLDRFDKGYIQWNNILTNQRPFCRRCLSSDTSLLRQWIADMTKSRKSKWRSQLASQSDALQGGNPAPAWPSLLSITIQLIHLIKLLLIVTASMPGTRNMDPFLTCAPFT